MNYKRILVNTPFLHSQRNPVRSPEIPNLREREKRSGLDFSEGHVTQLNIEMGIRKGKTLYKALQERQKSNSEAWRNYSNQGCFTKYLDPGP